jgi:hypothetical protein
MEYTTSNIPPITMIMDSHVGKPLLLSQKSGAEQMMDRKTASKNGTIIEDAARIPATTMIKEAAVKRNCEVLDLPVVSSIQ